MAKDSRLHTHDIAADDFFASNEVHVVSFIWQLIRVFDPSAKGKSMEVWVEEQEALEDALTPTEQASFTSRFEQAIEADLSRVGDEIRRISATGTRCIAGQEEQEEDEEEFEVFDKAAYDRAEFEAERALLKERYFGGDFSEEEYLRRKNHIYEAFDQAAPVPELNRRQRGKNIFRLVPTPSTTSTHI